MKYTVAVRALCEFAAKRGDLDVRFTPSPTANDGIAGHALMAARRDAQYESEIVLSGDYQMLHVRGRADGFDPARNQLEEFKTYRGPLDRMPGNHRELHWAQARVYGWLLCQARGLNELRVALVYFDIATQEETSLVETRTAGSLRDFFEGLCNDFLMWSQQELAHRLARNGTLQQLRFPYAAFHDGQRDLAQSVFRSVSQGRCLMAQAPTGIGKTVATLFPLLKAFERTQLDKVFFLTAKTSGRKLALDTLALLKRSEPALRLRVIELVAREKSCEYPDRQCHGESCPLAAGFYDRLPAARVAAIAIGRLDQPAVRAVALEHRVCPYYLSQELTRWCDVIVGDYNYYFDFSAMLFRMMLLNQWRVSVLVDEAHNLLTRGRQMYTAELNEQAFQAVRRTAPLAVRGSLDRVDRSWQELNHGNCEYSIHESVPDRFIQELETAVAVMAEHLSIDLPGPGDTLLNFYFDALHFCRIAESFDAHSLFDVTQLPTESHGGGSVACIRNVVPAPHLRQRFSAARNTVLFSATLSPQQFYRDTLGLPRDTKWLEVGSPFSSEQLSVQVAGDISTRYRHRSASLSPIVELIAGQYRRHPGNYLAFFSSFEYLHNVATLFESRYPHIAIWKQQRAMPERERTAFLDRFQTDQCGIGFAVLGGAFGEGIDLPGDRLIGAFIATLGLPQINAVNEAICERMTQLFAAGYDYTYLYPGLQKVVQAAGRVIRTRADRGIVHLMDDRFALPQISKLLPSWWQLDATGSDSRPS